MHHHTVFPSNTSFFLKVPQFVLSFSSLRRLSSDNTDGRLTKIPYSNCNARSESSTFIACCDGLIHSFIR